MATDNTILNKGHAGDTVRLKKRSNDVKTQIVGIDINPGGSTETLMSAGQQLAAASMPVVLASDQPPVSAVGNTALLTVTPTITTTPYTANDCVGGKITLTNAMRVSGGTAILQSLTVVDLSNQKVQLELFFFDADPVGGTYTDNAPAVFATADLAKFIGRVTIAASDYTTYDTKATASPSSLGRVLKAATGTSLYLVILTPGTPTYVVGALLLRLGLLRD